jgi:hypothetical protein
MDSRELESLRRIRTDDELAVTLTLTVRLHANGAMSVEGPTGDKAFCRRLLDEAWAAINRQPTKGALIIPAHDVDSRAQESYQ